MPVSSLQEVLLSLLAVLLATLPVTLLSQPNATVLKQLSTGMACVSSKDSTPPGLSSLLGINSFSLVTPEPSFPEVGGRELEEAQCHPKSFSC